MSRLNNAYQNETVVPDYDIGEPALRMSTERIANAYYAIKPLLNVVLSTLVVFGVPESATLIIDNMVITSSAVLGNQPGNQISTVQSDHMATNSNTTDGGIIINVYS